VIAEHPVVPSASARTSERAWWKWVTPAVLTLAALVVFGYMRGFDQVFVANTPTGGDMGAHVLLPAFLRDHLLPQGRLLGWSNSWYAGFPVFYFYFPLPPLVMVALDVVLPYGVAFKLVTLAGLVAMPFAAYFFVRAMGFSRPVSLVGGIAGGSFVFMESFSIYGGNTLSTLAGEYAFSWSFALSIVYLGIVIRNVRAGKGFTVGAGVVLALTALCHVITTLVVVLASLPLLLRRKGPSNVVGASVLGFAIAAFWALPFLVDSSLTTNMGWSPVTGIDQVFPSELWPMVVLAAGGLAWAVMRRYLVSPAVALLVLPVVGYYVLQHVEFRKLYNARFLPYWYFTVFVFAGIAVGAAVVAAARRFRGGHSIRWSAAGMAALVFLGVAVLGVHSTPAWAKWNYSGYEGKQTYAYYADGTPVMQDDFWAQYMGYMQTLDSLPPGRVMWENNNGLNSFGTPMALMLSDYWTPGHPSMEGLLFESSLTTPFHFLMANEVSQRPSNAVAGLQYRGMDFDRGVPHLGLYDIAYYVSYTPTATQAAKDYGLPVIAESPPFTFFQLPQSSLVDVATYQPAVWDGSGAFYDATLDWFDDVDHLDRWLTETGPADWVRIDDVSNTARKPVTGSGAVSDVVLNDESISFHTTAIGVPHLIKVTYFPNWTAHGADGPYRAAPSLMVVVPTQEDVTLTFDNRWPETAGLWLTIAGIGAAIGLTVVARRRREHAG